MHSKKKKGDIVETNGEIRYSASSEITGPLPTPEDIQKYNELIPNGAERLMLMAEKEQLHRHAINLDLFKHNSIESKRSHTLSVIGQIFGIIVFLAIVGLSLASIYYGHPAIAIAAIGIAMGVVAIFVGGRYHQNKSKK